MNIVIIAQADGGLHTFTEEDLSAFYSIEITALKEILDDILDRRVLAEDYKTGSTVTQLSVNGVAVPRLRR